MPMQLGFAGRVCSILLTYAAGYAQPPPGIPLVLPGTRP